MNVSVSFFTVKTMLWNIWVFIFFIIFNNQNIRSYWLIILLQPFLIFWRWWKTFFPIIIIYKRLNLWYSLQVFYNTYNVTAYQKHLWSSFTGFIVAFLVVAFLIVICCYSFYPIRKICIQSSTIYTYWMTFVIHFNGTFKKESLLSIDVSIPIWYLQRTKLKIWLVTLFL